MGDTINNMEMKMSTEENQNLTVEGYTFRTTEDARLAKLEAQKIEFIEKRINYNRADSVLALYKKAVEERTFQTPVGIRYLEKLHDFLESSPVITEEIPPIPLQSYFSRTVRENANPARHRVTPMKKRDILKRKYRISVILNIVLVLMVAAMFAIALNAKNPNMLNYEKALVNKYSEWEQELSTREAAIREKEKEMNVTE